LRQSKFDLDVEKKKLGKELFSISFFSFLHQASMPFGDIVDGVFLSDLDAAALGAKGIARSSQNSINKLLNSALSKSTISMIASANGSNNRKQGEG
jgi:Na+-driven multidrug efflux pump